MGGFLRSVGLLSVLSGFLSLILQFETVPSTAIKPGHFESTHGGHQKGSIRLQISCTGNLIDNNALFFRSSCFLFMVFLDKFY